MSHYRLTAAIAMTIFIGGGLYFYRLPAPVKVERPEKIVRPNPVHGFGIVDLEQIIAAHPDGAYLKELYGKEIRLKLELNEMMRPVKIPELPEITKQPFDDSAREKKMQNLMEQLAELKAHKQRLAEKYRKDTEEEHIQKRNSIREVYANEEFNVILKLQNADVLRLTQEQVDELNAQLDKIVMERNAKQLELLNEWTAEIEAYVESQTAEDEARLHQQVKDDMSDSQEEATKKYNETVARNRALRDAALQEIKFRQARRQEISEDLKKTSREREKLDNQILDEIAGEAGKLAAILKLQMVLAKVEPNYAEEKFSYSFESKFKLGQKKSPGAVIFAGNDTKDLTEDLVKAMTAKGVFQKKLTDKSGDD